jgi:opacity protein-like surface antigen
MKKIILSIASVFCFSAYMMAADPVLNPLITAMPSLSIAPDARSAGMGDVGVATTADLNSLYWNAAKFAYMDSHGGITANYTPWLRKLVGEIDLAHLEGYYKWDDVQGIAGSFTYFSMGTVQLTDEYGNTQGDCSPKEWAHDVTYNR